MHCVFERNYLKEINEYHHSNIKLDDVNGSKTSKAPMTNSFMSSGSWKVYCIQQTNYVK